ncbi:GMC family oxidoreductase N-terminal domain-containing protein [Croceicoccus sp. BE223]|uniref:GMC family oxidoreductase n=1 Tax=Croceicoccus sp. BE223 TaxID=2817716 RepID=UPI002867180F|nr:GMC family oxidoreductase N-terminal domain-containing protein [Croceicoccus sp. BE223]MDR7103743.1 choline dehydrogenase [Croceicoccus sp. BE223]
MQAEIESFDYVIVGAGSAGCALAARLSARADITVLLLEAGGDDRILKNPGQARTNALISIPAGVAKAMEDPRVNWGYESALDPVTGRRHVLPRGRVLGGSSSINGMIYARGQREDYDGWREMGCIGWGWDDLSPCFRRMETNLRGEDEYRGGSGPVAVSDVGPLLPISHAARQACIEAGIPANPDIWGASQEGVTPIQVTVANGRRASSSAAYLRPALKRTNLCLRTDAEVLQIEFEGRQVSALSYRHRGELRRVRARYEIVLCGGSVGSPMLLERSGVGQGERLRALGIEVVHESRDVGENLQEHYNASLQYQLRPGVLAFTQMSRGLNAVRTALQYGLTRKGLMAGSVGQMVAYAKTDPALDRPDFKILFMLIATTTRKVGEKHTLAIDPNPGITLMTCQLRPESRGSTHITGLGPDDKPDIRPEFLSTAKDREVTLKAVRRATEIAAQPALAKCIERPLTLPEGSPDDDVLYSALLRTGHPGQHLAGSCRMGGDGNSVVDHRLRVRGIEGLRIADCSIMPQLVSGNTNVPAMMIGERASDILLADRNTTA